MKVALSDIHHQDVTNFLKIKVYKIDVINFFRQRLWVAILQKVV